MQVLIIPVVFALEPDNHSLNPKSFLNTLRTLNLSNYEFKIASVASKYPQNKALQNVARSLVQSVTDLTEF